MVGLFYYTFYVSIKCAANPYMLCSQRTFWCSENCNSLMFCVSLFCYTQLPYLYHNLASRYAGNITPNDASLHCHTYHTFSDIQAYISLSLSLSLLHTHTHTLSSPSPWSRAKVRVSMHLQIKYTLFYGT